MAKKKTVMQENEDLVVENELKDNDIFEENENPPTHKEKKLDINELIEKGEQSISEIAAACGYSDYSYFAKVFKKSTGKTPKPQHPEVMVNFKLESLITNPAL